MSEAPQWPEQHDAQEPGAGEQDAQETGEAQQDAHGVSAEDLDAQGSGAEESGAQELGAEEQYAQEPDVEELDAQSAGAEEQEAQEVDAEELDSHGPEPVEQDAQSVDAEKQDVQEVDAEELDSHGPEPVEQDPQSVEAEDQDAHSAGVEEPGAQEPGEEQHDAQSAGAQEPGAEEPSAEEPGAEEPAAPIQANEARNQRIGELRALITQREEQTASVEEEAQAPRAAAPRVKAKGYPGAMEMTRSLLMVVVVALFILTFIVQPFRIPSESMERTLLVGDFLLVNKTAFAPAGHWGWLLPYQKIERGDIIVFHFPPNPPEHVVKRVIGLPGDRVHLQNGEAWVNGEALDEPWAVYEPAYPDDFRDSFPTQLYTDPGVDPQWWMEMRRDVREGDLVVPPGEYFVLGDNRNFSRDSRYWGFVPEDHIVGRPFIIYFSLRQPSTTDTESPDDRLGQKNDPLSRIEDFARWDRFLRVVR